MSLKSARLPSHLPVGSKYILESRGTMKGSMLVNRYVELPDGRRIPTWVTDSFSAPAPRRTLRHFLYVGGGGDGSMVVDAKCQGLMGLCPG